jgi:crossover junction endodeoxyribonuclease RuvC
LTAAITRVLGIDPGTAATGYGVVDCAVGDSLTLIAFGVLRTAPPACMADRLADLYGQLGRLILAQRPDAVAVEELFFSSNVTTAMTVGQARGVVLLAAAMAGIPVAEYKPNEIKLALTGYGRADKRQMQDMLRLVLGLPEPPRPDDAADGVAVALCHLRLARLRQLGADAAGER